MKGYNPLESADLIRGKPESPHGVHRFDHIGCQLADFIIDATNYSALLAKYRVWKHPDSPY
tara:strand:- start:420 stop:602 length:183 start_codon:yes stop_codon:yes gene_type:complete